MTTKYGKTIDIDTSYIQSIIKVARDVLNHSLIHNKRLVYNLRSGNLLKMYTLHTNDLQSVKSPSASVTNRHGTNSAPLAQKTQGETAPLVQPSANTDSNVGASLKPEEGANAPSPNTGTESALEVLKHSLAAGSQTMKDMLTLIKKEREANL